MACEEAKDDLRDAWNDMLEASKEQAEAEERLEDEQGFWEEETAGDAAGILTIGGAIVGGILTGGIGGLIIAGLGGAAGGFGIGYAENDRQDDIDAAQAAVDAANRDMARAEREWNRGMAKLCRCLAAEEAQK